MTERERWESCNFLQKQCKSVAILGGCSSWAPGDKIGLLSSATLESTKCRLHSWRCNFAPHFWAKTADVPVMERLKKPLDGSIAQSLPLVCMPGHQDHHAGQSGEEHAPQCHSSMPCLHGFVSVPQQGTSRDTFVACSHHSHHNPVNQGPNQGPNQVSELLFYAHLWIWRTGSARGF